MRIDGASPIQPAVSQPVAGQPKATPVPAAAVPDVKDQVDTHPAPAANSTNVLVEMQPGNIVIYKFIDEASGRLIQQIPSQQMLELSQPAEAPKDKKRS
ncbi:MAG: hypothetical protein ACRD3H_03105 [Terriglobales bacterium]|jgi:hypothetical protein|nr:hypothetical protein [Terriglobales bacterium]